MIYAQERCQFRVNRRFLTQYNANLEILGKEPRNDKIQLKLCS